MSGGDDTGLLPRNGEGVSRKEAPYPLLRRFLVLVLPPLVLALAGLLFAVSFALSTSVERAYEAQAVQRHARLLDAARAAEGDETSVAGEARELGLSCALITQAGGTQIRAGEPPCPELTAEDREDLASAGTLFREVGGSPMQWMVASIHPSGDGPVTVVSVEDAGRFERLIGSSAMLWVGGLAIALLAATGLALVLVVRAQREIDRRTEALNAARDAIARFVSRHVRTSALGDQTARRCETAVLFMDIRDFSGYADTASPEAAAKLVTEVAEIGFSAVLAHGGDVDRLVGDGLVARFDGRDRDARAFAAATAILTRVAAAHLPRAVGVGLIDGVVVEATIATGERADATILGRTVNIGARLCSAAGPGEIVAAAAMPTPAGHALKEIGTEALTLKGHREPFRAHRYVLAANPGAPS